LQDLITIDDLAPFATIAEDKAQAMIDDATAMAAVSAPCLTGTLTGDQLAAVKAVLRGAVLRWNQSGQGAVSAQAMGPFSVAVDTRQPRRALFWPAEIEALQQICNPDEVKAFSIDTAANPMVARPTFGGWYDYGWTGFPGGWNDDGTLI